MHPDNRLPPSSVVAPSLVLWDMDMFWLVMGYMVWNGYFLDDWHMHFLVDWNVFDDRNLLVNWHFFNMMMMDCMNFVWNMNNVMFAGKRVIIILYYNNVIDNDNSYYSIFLYSIQIRRWCALDAN